MRRSLYVFLLATLCSCYNQGPLTPDAWDLTEQQLDSISFYTTHHYTQGFNFVVSKDSLVILEQQNEMMPSRSTGTNTWWWPTSGRCLPIR